MKRLLCLLLLAGCASAPRPSGRSRHPEELRQAEAQLRQIVALEAELSQSWSAATPPCAQICPLAQNISRLSGLICELAQRHPDDDALAADCREAQAAPPAPAQKFRPPAPAVPNPT